MKEFKSMKTKLADNLNVEAALLHFAGVKENKEEAEKVRDFAKKANW